MSVDAELVIEDRYPTRLSRQPKPQERMDPVVWGDGANGPLDEADLGQFDERGYLTIEGLIDDARASELQWEVRRLIGRTDPSDERVVLEPDGSTVRSLFEVHQLSQLFAELAHHPALLDPARQILGSDVYVHQSRINVMPGFRGTGFSWHSDFETWHAEDGMPAMRAVSLSLALTANRAWNGSLLVIPGSHRRFIGCRGATPHDHYRQSLRAQEIGTPPEGEIRHLVAERGIDMICGPPGMATYFDSNLMHGSNGNVSPDPRVNLFVVYNSVENALAPPFAAETRRPNFVAARRLATSSRVSCAP